MKIEFAQVVTQIISFLVMLWVLRRYAWEPLLKIMEDRRNKIQADFNAIKEQRADADKFRRQYDEKLKNVDIEARAIVREAVEKGRILSGEIENEAKVNARRMMAKTQDDLQQEIHKAKIQLKDDLVNLTLLATRKIIGTSMNPEQEKKLIGKFIEESEKL